MTKYSKIKKSSFAILALSLILVAVLAFGGTYAYFSATAAGTGSIVTGTLTLTGDESELSLTDSEDSLVPNQTVTVSADAIKLKGNTVSALRAKLTVTKITKSDNTAVTDSTTLAGLMELTVTVAASSDASWLKHDTDGYYYYNTAVVGSEEGVALDAEFSIKLKATVGDEYQGATIDYSLTVEAAQAEYHETGANGADVEPGVTTWSTAADVAKFWASAQ